VSLDRVLALAGVRGYERLEHGREVLVRSYDRIRLVSEGAHPGEMQAVRNNLEEILRTLQDLVAGAGWRIHVHPGSSIPLHKLTSQGPVLTTVDLSDPSYTINGFTRYPEVHVASGDTEALGHEFMHAYDHLLGRESKGSGSKTWTKLSKELGKLPVSEHFSPKVEGKTRAAREQWAELGGQLIRGHGDNALRLGTDAGVPADLARRVRAHFVAGGK